MISILRQIHGKSHSLTDGAVMPHCALFVDICVLDNVSLSEKVDKGY